MLGAGLGAFRLYVLSTNCSWSSTLADAPKRPSTLLQAFIRVQHIVLRLPRVVDDMERIEFLKQGHRCLQRIYGLHAAKVRELWPAFEDAQRAEVVKASKCHLKHSKDTSHGQEFKVVPEWNLQNVIESGPTVLLDLLEHRATHSLYFQCFTGPHGDAGDAEVILESIRTHGAWFASASPHEFIYCDSEERYGQSFKAKDDARWRDIQTEVSTISDSRQYLPRATGGMILARQMHLTGALHQVIVNILRVGSTTRIKNERPERDTKAVQDALTKLSIAQKPNTVSVGDLLVACRGYKSFFDDGTTILYNEPAALLYKLRCRFSTQPDSVPDDKGREIFAFTDQHASSVFFEMIHDALATTARWRFISLLLELLREFGGTKSFRVGLLRHLSDACHAEYACSQKLLQRCLTPPKSPTQKYFVRVSNPSDNGVAQVNQKQDPNDLRLPRKLAYMRWFLQLCHHDTTPSKAPEKIKKLDDLWRLSTEKKDEFDEAVEDALGSLTIIVSFIQSLSASFKLPSARPANKSLFVNKAAILHKKIDVLKDRFDVSAYAWPFEILLEPDMAHGALKSLSQLVVDKAGATPESLYQNLVDTCIADIKKNYQLKQDALEKHTEPAAEESSFVAPFGAIPEAPDKFVVQQRREKEKTRPANPPPQDIAPQLKSSSTPAPNPEPARVFSVKRSTFSVFSTMFSKEQSHGSVHWTSFKSAMADLHFGVKTFDGSGHTFVPPAGENFAQNSVVLHRPHGSRLEGKKLRDYAKRLNKAYGWGEASFQVA